MKNLLAPSLATFTLWVGDGASAQTGTMMNGGTGAVGWMGSFGGYWVPVLLVVVVGLLAWIVMQKRK